MRAEAIHYSGEHTRPRVLAMAPSPSRTFRPKDALEFFRFSAENSTRDATVPLG